MRQSRKPFPLDGADENSSIRVVWLFKPEGWCAHLGPGAPGAVPYFPPLERSGEFRTGKRIEFDALDLLCGVLYAWSALFEPERCEDPAVRRRFLLRLLEDLRRELGWATIEQLILDAAAERKKDYGPGAAIPMLLAGRDIRPESFKIRSDLILDLWLLLEESDEIDPLPVCQCIVEQYEGMDLQALNTNTREQIVYLYGAALHLLGQHRAFKRHFQGAVQSVVEHPTLMSKLWRIVRGERLGLRELKVFKRRVRPDAVRRRSAG